MTAINNTKNTTANREVHLKLTESLDKLREMQKLIRKNRNELGDTYIPSYKKSDEAINSLTDLLFILP